MKGFWPRAFADIALFASILFLPWWASALLALAFLFTFESYVEALMAGFLADALYGTGEGKFLGAEYVMTLAAAAAFFMSLYLKSVLRYYR